MNFKQKVLKEFPNTKFRRVRYYKQSPYQKRRYKPEFVEQEVWLYTNNSQYGYCIVESDFTNKKYWKGFRDMIINENK